MVKKIKFNLIIDNHYVRNLEDLRDNFNIDDILRYYRNDLLKKWLSVRGYNELCERLESISSQNNFETAKELVKIFEIEISANQIEEALYSIKFHQQWQRNINSNANKNSQQQSLINSYCNGYDALLQNMLNNKDNMQLIKIAMGQISKNYLGIFNYHMLSFFDEFLENAPLAIFASLMNPVLRDKLLSSTLIQKKTAEKLIKEQDIIDSHLKTFKGDTKQYWNVIESKGNQFMIVSMIEGNFVRNAGNDEEKLSAKDVNGKFPILDGIDYMSNYSHHEIGYLEV